MQQRTSEVDSMISKWKQRKEDADAGRPVKVCAIPTGTASIALARSRLSQEKLCLQLVGTQQLDH